jgi:dTDP-4-dehydrorhamnose 3,5-epimerase-like enzyme
MDFKNTTVQDCKLIDLPKIHNRLGNITAVENLTTIPFSVKRVYYLYDVPSNEERGGHAHYELQQFIVAVSGSFDVVLKDGINKRTVSLNRPNRALHIIPGMWREICNFSGGSVCLVLASLQYNEKDYIRDYIDFKNVKKKDNK